MVDRHVATGSYALDAVEDGQRAVIDAHLAACPTCRDEVAGFAESLAELALLTRAVPPPALRFDILDIIDRTPQLVGRPDR